MRSVINISLPTAIKNEVERAVRGGGYATKSEFFRDLLRLWREEQILREVNLSREQIAIGKGKVLKSLKDFK